MRIISIFLSKHHCYISTTITNQYGFFVVDTLVGKVLLYNGEQFDEISKHGKEFFFRDELKFKFKKEIETLTYQKTNIWVAGPYVQYQVVKYNGKVWDIHRLVGSFLFGVLDSKELVCHKNECNSRKCFRPAHLYKGTYISNTRDALIKGTHNIPGLYKRPTRTYCKLGHKITLARGRCKICNKLRMREARAKLS